MRCVQPSCHPQTHPARASLVGESPPRDTKSLYLTRALIPQRREWFLRDFESASNEKRLDAVCRRKRHEFPALKDQSL